MTIGTWVLVIWFLPLYGTQSTSTTSVPGFSSESACEEAAKKMRTLEENFRFKIKTACLQQ